MVTVEHLDRESGVKKILLLSDDRIDTRYIEQQFMDTSGLNCKLYRSSSIKEALEQLESKQIDVLILDMRLAGIESPQDLHTTIKKSHPHIPIILLTEDIEKESISTTDVLSGGAFGPIHRKTINTLVTLIKTILIPRA